MDHVSVARRVPPTLYAQSAGAKIAYQVSGEGPCDLVFVPGLVSHLDLQWQQLSYRRFVTALEHACRVIRFDKRSTVLSDPTDARPSMDQRVVDLAAVMDVDWNLFGCARKGHVSYAPDEPELRDRLMAPTAGGTAWRCLRCGAFVTDGQHGSGPAAAAPMIRRGKELRSELILRVFAVERFLRFLIFGGAAYGVWRFLELVESVGLWLAKRWGEYFAMVATSIFLPYEVYDLTVKITWLRIVAFVVNPLLVIYLVWTKRLFGVRGGKRAYETRLRSESVIEVEQAALAAGIRRPAPWPAGWRASSAAWRLA